MVMAAGVNCQQPSYKSGALQLPHSFSHSFTRLPRDGHAARFDGKLQIIRTNERLLTFPVYRHITFSPDESEQLTKARERALFWACVRSVVLNEWLV